MDQVCKRFPHLIEKIVKKLDYLCLTKCMEASREMCDVLNNGKVLWKQMILKNVTGKAIFNLYK